MSPTFARLLHGMDSASVAVTAGRLQELSSLAAALCCPLLLIAAGYALACRIWPYRNCYACQGTGMRRSPTRRAFRICRACGGTGGQLRLGRRLYNRYTNRRGTR